jgi:hypothetical protein
LPTKIGSVGKDMLMVEPKAHNLSSIPVVYNLLFDGQFVNLSVHHNIKGLEYTLVLGVEIASLFPNFFL